MTLSERLGQAFKKNSDKEFQAPLKYYSSCKELPLYNFCEVINTKDYNFLLKDSSKKLDKNVAFVWGEILLEYAELDSNNGTLSAFEDTLQLRALQNAYTTIKAMIRLLYVVTPSHPKYGEKAKDVIKDLKSMGYIVDASSSKRYKKSLLKIDKKSNNLITLINIKKNEIKINQDDEGESVSYDEIMATLMPHFNINDQITVARYCACKKILRKKQKKK